MAKEMDTSDPLEGFLRRVYGLLFAALGGQNEVRKRTADLGQVLGS